ncbi:MAG: FG-GAP repeat protein [Anaerolineales bacterium]|nr:FG-GAP repeat protein [Anaerolineales bacterium]
MWQCHVSFFTRAGGVWTQQAYLKASNTEAGDYFGWDVSLFGDTLVVTARYEDSNATGGMAIRPIIQP